MKSCLSLTEKTDLKQESETGSQATSFTSQLDSETKLAMMRSHLYPDSLKNYNFDKFKPEK